MGRRADPGQGAGCNLRGGAAPSRALLGTKWLISPEPGWSPGWGEACVDGMVLAAAFPCSNFPCCADTERISSVPGRWRVGFTGGRWHPCPGILWAGGMSRGAMQTSLDGALNPLLLTQLQQRGPGRVSHPGAGVPGNTGSAGWGRDMANAASRARSSVLLLLVSLEPLGSPAPLATATFRCTPSHRSRAGADPACGGGPGLMCGVCGARSGGVWQMALKAESQRGGCDNGDVAAGTAQDGPLLLLQWLLSGVYGGVWDVSSRSIEGSAIRVLVLAFRGALMECTEQI